MKLARGHWQLGLLAALIAVLWSTPAVMPLEIFSDAIARFHLRSDARMLAEDFGGATLIWVRFWLLVSLAVIAAVLRYGLGRDSNIRLRGC